MISDVDLRIALDVPCALKRGLIRRAQKAATNPEFRRGLFTVSDTAREVRI